MKIKVTNKITNYEGKEMEKITIRSLISETLNSPVEENEKLTAEDKSKIYQLSVKVYSANEIDFSLDERAFIKERAGKTLFPMFYGKLCEILEDKEEEKKK